MSLVAVLFLTLLLVTASMNSTGPPSECDPLVPESCSLPFPNDFWLIKDSNNTPMNLALSTNNFPLPKLSNISTVDPLEWNALLDGFSPLPCILTFFSNLSINNCPRLWNISQSIADDTKENIPIIILQASNNKHVPYWVESDHISDTPVTHRERNRTLMIWPAERLIDGERYIIGIRNLITENGNEIQVSSAFQSLRDSTASNDTSVNFRRQWFNDEIFPLLIANGFERHSLQLAWDFTVQSTKSLTATMIYMRNDAFSRIDAQGVQYRITSIVDNPSSLEYIGRKIKGLMSVPWYLNDRLPGINVRIVREWSFNPLIPVFQQMNEIEFEMLIPESITNLSMNSSQIRFLQYGHGLFSSFHEIEDEYLRQISNQYGYILAGVNWLGMCSEDIVVISEIMFLNITNFPAIPDRLHQGMLNALFLMKLMMSSNFQNDKTIFAFKSNTSVVNVNTARNYYGNSLGGILGAVYMSLTTDVIRGVLDVPGSPFSLLLPRSSDFAFFELGEKVEYWEDFGRVQLLSFIQLLWNSLEPSGYINHLNDVENTFDDTPVHNVLIQYSLGDAEVTWLSAQIIGRTLGCFMYESQVPEYNETLFGYQWLADDAEVIVINGSSNVNACLIQGWNYGVPQVPFINVPPDAKYDTHGKTKLQANAQQANYVFFSQGIIYNACGGPCNAVF